mmetsp:Transcript_11309/g.12959  ORF Transcript_11309/g.12959 Transcript_11309/m.12959 type:complete len:453 (-) Transcript_11309:877-2235(-)|eukprot:CAMPEP_0184016646 /NCGR_PEP_ID=MMETSP0954-20121128/7048_1 /TAXON_ID=627963 /ORGANISM="Aplanochytrium sp, Strain PBS07" /LENGTH=452 /DNA_ID=CAMNT_0026297697 /DNA_START=151 /DNA_END=1509 /DNA_ORIENTATION=-
MPSPSLIELETSTALAAEDASAAEKWTDQYARHAILMSRLKPPPSSLSPAFDRSKFFHAKGGDKVEIERHRKKPEATEKSLSPVVVEEVHINDKHCKLLARELDPSRNKRIQVFKILRLNKHDADSQFQGLKYLYSSGWYDELIDMGIGRILVEAMKNHPKDERIHSLTCKIMSVASHAETRNVHQFDRNADTLMRFGGGQAVLKSMRDNIGQKSVQLNALYALFNMTFYSVERQRALAKGGILATQIVDTMNSYSDRDIQIECCAAVSHFAAESSDFFIKAGVLPAIVRAMEKHQESDELMELAAEALKDLFRIARFEYRGLLGKHMAPKLAELVKFQVRRENDSHSVLKQLISVVAKFCTHSENRRVFVEAGLDELVLAAFNKASEDGPTVCWILYTINLLIYYNAQESKKMKNLNAAKLIKSALKRHKIDFIQRNGRDALRMLQRKGKA